MTHRWTKIAAVGVLCICTVGATACQFYTDPSGWSDGVGASNTLYEVATELGNKTSEGEWMDDVTGASSEAYRTYQDAKKEGYDGTFLEFLKEIGYSADDGAYSIGSAVQSVVSVYSTFTLQSTSSRPSFPWFGGSFGESSSQATSVGAGVIYQLDKENGDAYIVTNYHVVYYADSKGDEEVRHVSDEIRICLYGMTTDNAIRAEYVGGAMQYDIAVLKIEDSDILRESAARSARLADSDAITAGEKVYAVGNPEGEGISVSSGVVSVEAEYIEIYAADDKTVLNMLEIRTDTAVNHGNSGGGLFNADGRLIGIVNARLEDDGVDSFGYAIPSNLATSVAQNIIDNSLVNASRKSLRGRLGVTLQVTGKKSVYSETTGKSYIQETVSVVETQNGALADGVLKAGDILYSVSINDGPEEVVTRLHMVDEILFRIRLGDTLKIVCQRDGVLQEHTVVFSRSEMFQVVD